MNLSPISWPERTGISSYVYQLVRAYASDPAKAEAMAGFVYSRRKAAQSTVEDLAGFPIRSLRLPEKATFRLLRLPHLNRWGMAGLRVYHETSLYPRPVPPACKMIYTLYDVLPLIHPDWYSPFSVREYKSALNRASRTAGRIIVQSRAALRDVLQAAPRLEKKLIFIPNGVDRREFRPDIPAETVKGALAGLGLKPPYILFTGAIQPRKNVDGLIRAFLHLIGDIPHTLVLAGPVGWKGREILAAIEDDSARGRIRHLGFVPAQWLPALYQAADLYVFPSRGEGFGLTVLEAMASGVPVVTSSVSAMPEVAGQAALLVHPDDGEALAAAMRRTLEDRDLRRTMIEAGLRRAGEFPWSRTADLTWKLYEEAKEPA
ncbi:MAG: glycosyltransferase family 1 protein [Candidatus Aminicenantes bacterium]|nr:glycosyltransferase family 1 protein [Candidatus Aminicenantes bacterium]